MADVLLPLGSQNDYGVSYSQLSLIQVKAKVTLRLTVSRPVFSWCQAPTWGPRPDFYYSQLPVCWRRETSLRRGRVCRLQLLLAFASAVILGSGAHGTRDHILLSQNRDSPKLEDEFPVFISPRNRMTQLYPPGTEFHFRRLLQLAGLRWKYSNPPPRGHNSNKSESKLGYDRRSVDRRVFVSSTHLGPKTWFLLLSRLTLRPVLL
jgi:hypothetical protein